MSPAAAPAHAATSHMPGRSNFEFTAGLLGGFVDGGEFYVLDAEFAVFVGDRVDLADGLDVTFHGLDEVPFVVGAGDGGGENRVALFHFRVGFHAADAADEFANDAEKVGVAWRGGCYVGGDGPALGVNRRGVEPAPHFFGHIWHEGCEQFQQGAQRDGAGCGG